LSRSLINNRNLAIAMEHSERHRVALADAVVDLGFVSELDSYSMLAAATGLRLIELSSVTPNSLALHLLPERVARHDFLLPIEEDNRVLTYAISRRFNDDAERDVAFASGRRPQAVLARRSDLQTALDKYYQNLSDIDLLLKRVRSEIAVEMIDCGDAEARSD